MRRYGEQRETGGKDDLPLMFTSSILPMPERARFVASFIRLLEHRDPSGLDLSFLVLRIRASLRFPDSWTFVAAFRHSMQKARKEDVLRSCS